MLHPFENWASWRHPGLVGLVDAKAEGVRVQREVLTPSVQDWSFAPFPFQPFPFLSGFLQPQLLLNDFGLDATRCQAGVLRISGYESVHDCGRSDKASCARRSDDTDVRREALRCFGRSDRRALDREQGSAPWKGAIRIAKVGGTVAARASHDRRLNGTSRVDLQARTMLTAASIAILSARDDGTVTRRPAGVGTAGDGHLPGGSRRSQPSPRMDSRRSKACNCRRPRGCEVCRDREARGSRTRLRGVASLAAGREGPWLPPATARPWWRRWTSESRRTRGAA